nr:integrase core domain-containing protein [Leptospira stimsonii]
MEHRTTKVRRPQSNGYVERLHRTLLDEHFRISGRTKFYESIEEMQIDLEIFFEEYNYKRAHQGRNGRTPFQVFIHGIKIKESEKLNSEDKSISFRRSVRRILLLYTSYLATAAFFSKNLSE